MKQPAESELIHNLIIDFIRLERRQRYFMQDALRASGLKGIMYKYIISIKRNPGTSQDLLAEFHSVDKSRITRVVRELENMGYISRSTNENDRRYQQLYLTAKGELIFDTIQQATMEWEAIISREIPTGDIAVTINTIEKMIANAD